MKFEIKLNSIKEYLRKLTISVQSVSSRIEFTGVLITVFDNSIVFEGRNNYMDTKIEETNLNDVKIIETGRVLIKANMLNEIIQKMSGEVVIFNKIDSNIVSIESEDSNYQINLLNDEKYDIATFEEFDDSVIINHSNFNKTISKVVFAGNEKHSKFIFQGLNLIIKDNILSSTVCDGVRIASFKTPITSDKNINKIIPLKVVKELIRILPNNGEYKFSFGNNKGIITSGNMINQFQLIEGTYPIFDKFFDSSLYTKQLVIKKHELDNAVERATILMSNKADTSNRIGLSITNELFTVESREMELGSSKIKVKDFSYSGDPINISLSPRILTEGLRVSESESIKLFMTEKTSSVLVISETDGLIYLLSPMA